MAASFHPDYETEVRDLVQSLIASCIQEIATEEPQETISLPTGGEVNPEDCIETIEELIRVSTGIIVWPMAMYIHVL